ncbi:MAG: DUF2846 domain-containing protein [Burkholderiales bacterium]|jgi:uncharacterized protein YceK|nr:DUF2846 domain-containing protein [Burkholderiales bacterium]
MKKIFAAFCILVMSGCASVQMGDTQVDARLKTFTPLKDKAALYVYRNETFGAALKMTVLLDGKILGDTASKTYLYAELEPGKHRLISKTENDSVLDFEAIAGKIYYVWQEVKMGLWQARSQLQMMDDKTGQAGVLESQLAVTPN